MVYLMEYCVYVCWIDVYGSFVVVKEVEVMFDIDLVGWCDVMNFVELLLVVLVVCMLKGIEWVMLMFNF